jgi:hypothetical protein
MLEGCTDGSRSRHPPSFLSQPGPHRRGSTDATAHRARVEVLGLWWDDGFAPRAATGFVDAMRHALGAYLRFAGASRLDWAPHLAADKHSSPSSPAETAATEQHPHTVPAAGLRAD